MNLNRIPSNHARARHHLGLVTILVCVSTVMMGGNQTEREPAAGPVIHATHILGFEGLRHNASGDLAIQGGSLQFQQDGTAIARVNTKSIQNISLGQEDEQVGGAPMTLGKAAIPFGGWRVVSLFSHKKVDTLTIEYLDSNGGLHGAIFRLTKGQGQLLKQELAANGANIATVEPQATVGNPQGGSNEGE